MFPLLPALMLLLLNGPSGLDRSTHDGSLPAALRALHHRIQEGHLLADRKLLRGIEQDLVLASLFTSGSDHELGKAVAQLLQLVEGVLPEKEIESESAHSGPRPTIFRAPLRRASQAFLSAARSRDGPAAR